jgi:hypothetical protein
MNTLYPLESQRMDLVGHLAELHRWIFICLRFLIAASLILFFLGRDLMALLKSFSYDRDSDFILIALNPGQ